MHSKTLQDTPHFKAKECRIVVDRSQGGWKEDTGKKLDLVRSEIWSGVGLSHKRDSISTSVARSGKAWKDVLLLF